MEPYGLPGPRQRERVVRYENMDELTKRIRRGDCTTLRAWRIDPHRASGVHERSNGARTLRWSHNIWPKWRTAEFAVKDAGPRMMKLQQILNGYVMDTKAGVILTAGCANLTRCDQEKS